jgi:hypothetical protein
LRRQTAGGGMSCSARRETGLGGEAKAREGGGMRRCCH